LQAAVKGGIFDLGSARRRLGAAVLEHATRARCSEEAGRTMELRR